MQGRTRQHQPEKQTPSLMAGATVGLAATAIWLVTAGVASASEIEIVADAAATASELEIVLVETVDLAQLDAAVAAVEAPAPPASIAPRFGALPPELSSEGRASGRSLFGEAGAGAPVLMIEQPKLGPLVMEQPVRVYENDVMVKIRAPGGNSSFATLELLF